MQRFLDRRDAGRQLAGKLAKYADLPNVLVLALPRGGVPVAFEIAKALKAPLDVWIVRKLGLPGEEELAIGAITSGGIRILNQEIVDALTVSQTVIDLVTEREKGELERRERRYRGEHSALEVHDRTTILVDDGLATGASMLAAVRAISTRHPAQIVVAIPVASYQAIYLLKQEVEEIFYVMVPESFEGVGKWYDDFSQTQDEEVISLLKAAEGGQ